MSDLKARLAAKNRKTAKVTSLDWCDGSAPTEVRIVKGTMGDRLKLLEKAQADGIIDADGKPTTTKNNVLLLARFVVAFVYEGAKPAFEPGDEESLVDDAPWLEDIGTEVMAVFNPEPEVTRGE